jgi:hypothetical protein
MDSPSAIVANNYDTHTHQAYFIASLKTRFPYLVFTEQMDSPEKKDVTVLTTSSPSSDLSLIKITLFKDDINIELPSIHFMKSYKPAIISAHLAPDADDRIPPRLQAVDFIQQIIEDKILFRCFRRKGKIIRIELVSVLSDTVKESNTYSILGLFIKLLSNYEVSDYRWSGLQT